MTPPASLPQGIVIPNMAIAILTTSLTPLFAWFYISHLDLGYLGAAHAVTSGYTLNLLCFAATFAAVNWRAQGTTEYMWPGWRWEMLKVAVAPSPIRAAATPPPRAHALKTQRPLAVPTKCRRLTPRCPPPTPPPPQGFGVILKIAFPTTMMICLDW